MGIGETEGVTAGRDRAEAGMAYWLNLANNPLPIFDQSPIYRCFTNISGKNHQNITDILFYSRYLAKPDNRWPIFFSVLTFTDSDNQYFKKCRYIGLTDDFPGLR